MNESKNLIDEIYTLFRKELPFIIRGEETSRSIIGNKENIFLEKRDASQKLIGCAVINKNTILLLIVDKAFQNQGIGSQLLSECESLIKKNGYSSVTLGVAFDYLMPGVPTSKKVVPAVNENLFKNVDSSAADFFEKRDYKHSWGDCNCFDMYMPLSKTIPTDYSVGDTINGITYRWATLSDIPEIIPCVDDACQFMDDSFSVFYKNESMYGKSQNEKVLIACKEDEVVGALIVSMNCERKDLGSVGCTSVSTKYSHQGIATNLIKLGTKYLQSIGLKDAFLSYTYTGLDKMYGFTGYEICIYYFKGEKSL